VSTHRLVHGGGFTAFLALLLTACGGGSGESPAPGKPPAITQFSADRAAYSIGERAQLTARFENGTALIQPGNVIVQNGQAVMSYPLVHGPNQFELIVSDGVTTARRTITLNATYRDRMRGVEAPFARAEHEAVRLFDGRVLIIGGEDATTTLPDALWVFDPFTERFSDFGASLSTGRIGFTAVTLYNGDVLIAGGERGLTGAPSAEIIRTGDRVVVPTAMPMQRARTWAAASLLMDGKVLISGGTAVAASDTVEVFDPATGVFTLLEGRLAVGRYAHTSVRIDTRRILIYGGFTLTGQPAPPEIYDPVDGLSRPLQPVEPNTRGNHQAHTMQDGGVLIIGGEDSDAVPLTSVLRFDPASGVIAPFADLATPRTFFALGRLADARVLLVGGVTGQSQGDVANTTEAFAMDRTRRDGPAMSHSRWHHTVTPLIDGRLLIVGGLGPDRQPIRGAEIYE
jgi:hypothetical protein